MIVVFTLYLLEETLHKLHHMQLKMEFKTVALLEICASNLYL